MQKQKGGKIVGLKNGSTQLLKTTGERKGKEKKTTRTGHTGLN